MNNITFEMGVTLAVLAGLLYGLIKDKPADVLFVGAVVLLAAFGVIGPAGCLFGFRQFGRFDRGRALCGGCRLARNGRDGLHR